jgi:Cft2 family RNA processing exonuclease
LKKIFLVHGEPRQQAALKLAIEEMYGVDVAIPVRGDKFDLGG